MKCKFAWEGGPQSLPCYYHNCLKRLRGQLTKLRQEAEILEKYDRFIEEQLKRGIIEPVVKSGKTEYVQYLTHRALVRKEAKMTKVRFVYNASSKDSEKGVSLNDSLRVGPPLTLMFFCCFVMAQGKGERH